MSETQQIEVNLKYLILPDYCYEDNRLSALQLKIFAFINSFRGDRFFFSNEHLGKMFNAHPISISKAITQLKDYGYIDITYVIKAEGGKIRFITNKKDTTSQVPLNQNAKSDLVKTLSLTKPKRLDNDNKINDNKINDNKYIIKRGVKSTHPSEIITTSDIKEVAEKYQVPEAFVHSVYEDMILWYEENPTRNKKTAWKITLMRWVKKDALQILDRERKTVNKFSVTHV